MSYPIVSPSAAQSMKKSMIATARSVNIQANMVPSFLQGYALHAHPSSTMSKKGAGATR